MYEDAKQVDEAETPRAMAAVRLLKELEHLDEVVVIFVNRLRPVLSPESPDIAAGEARDRVEPGVSAHVQDLHRMRERIETIRLRLEDANRRCEV